MLEIRSHLSGKGMVWQLPWHVACLLSMQACLYVEPAWSPEMNLGPEILSPTGADEHLFDLNLFRVVTVTVRETDGDDVLFIWDGVPQDNQEIIDLPIKDDVWASSLRVIDPDPSLDGGLVTVTVIDEAIPANRIEVHWRMLVGGP
jgi:hypothetical protein